MTAGAGRKVRPANLTMKIIRLAERNWRPDDATLVSTGDYRVGLDISEELAARAVAEGVAVEVVTDAPVAPDESSAAADQQPAPTTVRRKRAGV